MSDTERKPEAGDIWYDPREQLMFLYVNSALMDGQLGAVYLSAKYIQGPTYVNHFKMIHKGNVFVCKIDVDNLAKLITKEYKLDEC